MPFRHCRHVMYSPTQPTTRHHKLFTTHRLAQHSTAVQITKLIATQFSPPATKVQTLSTAPCSPIVPINLFCSSDMKFRTRTKLRVYMVSHLTNYDADHGDTRRSQIIKYSRSVTAVLPLQICSNEKHLCKKN